MKNIEILKIERGIQLLEGKGSSKLRWAVYRTTKKLQEEIPVIHDFINTLKNEKIKNLQQEESEAVKTCRTEKEREAALEKWGKTEQLQIELMKFIKSKEYKDFLASENESFKPYPFTVTADDLDGIEFNSAVFECLELIVEGVEEIMSEKVAKTIN
jgi:hypothetical protein